MVNKSMVMTVKLKNSNFESVEIILDDKENNIKFKCYKPDKNYYYINFDPKDFKEVVDFLFQYTSWRVSNDKLNGKSENCLQSILPPEFQE